MSTYYTQQQLEDSHIVRGDIESVGRRRYWRDRVVADVIEIGDYRFAAITYPATLEAHLVPGKVAAVVMTARRDGATLVAVLDRNGQLHVHPELPRMSGVVGGLARLDADARSRRPVASVGLFPSLTGERSAAAPLTARRRSRRRSP